MSIHVNEKGRPVYKVYEASLNERFYFFENDVGFIFFGSAVTSKYTRSMEPTLSNKLLNNFGKKEDACATLFQEHNCNVRNGSG